MPHIIGAFLFALGPAIIAQLRSHSKARTIIALDIGSLVVAIMAFVHGPESGMLYVILACIGGWVWSFIWSLGR
jgi:glucose uptake protein GlcU